MKTPQVLAALTALACTAVALIWWRASSPTDANVVASAANREAATSVRSGAVGRETESVEQLSSPPDDVSFAPSDAAASSRQSVQGPQSLDPRSMWPRAGSGRSANTSVDAAADPAVPIKLAFRALWYLGADPEAERTWSRAINDPNMPAGVRSDLIADMIDEGYTDNNNPTKADLPLILARLEIIERHAPYARDPVNAQAFAEIYRDLLEMYVRLGGVPRTPR